LARSFPRKGRKSAVFFWHDAAKGNSAMKAFRTLCLAASLLGLLGLAAPVAMAACAPPSASAAMQSELLAHLNAERKARGLAPLRLNDALDKAAQRHACDNAKRRTTSHVSGDGSKLQHRLKRVGYDYQAAAENTGRGFASGKRAVQWWMASPGHKKNMLMPDVREVGIGIAMSDAPDSRLHWILVMGRSF
jgi:uncharacterized protein YkwD